MAKTYENIKQQLELIARETTDGANTAQRVGGAVLDLLDYVYSQLAIVDSEAIQRALNSKADKAVVDIITRKVSCVVLIDAIIEANAPIMQEGTYLQYSSFASGHKLNMITTVTSKGGTLVPVGSQPQTTKVYVVSDIAYVYDGDSCKPIGGSAADVRRISSDLSDLSNRYKRFEGEVQAKFETTKAEMDGYLDKKAYAKDQELYTREQQVVNKDLQAQIDSINIYDTFQKKAQ